MRTKVHDDLERRLQELNAEIARKDALVSEAREKAEQLVEDVRSAGTNPLSDRDAFDKIDNAYTVADQIAQEAANLREDREKVLGWLGRSRPAGRLEGGPSLMGGVLERFMSTPEYRRLDEVGAWDGQSHIDIPGVEVVARSGAVRMLQAGRGVFGAIADIDAAVPIDQQLFPPVESPVRQVRVTSMVTVSTTDSDQVDYVEETTRTDAAAETAPGVAAPEATYAYTKRSALVRDIVHFTPAHRRNLADAGQMRGLLEGRLSNGVERRLESQIVSGDGSGENLAGILETAGIGSIAVGSQERTLTAIHRGITAVRLSLFGEPDAIGIHPSDYHEVVTDESQSGGYLLGNAAQSTPRTLWGFPAAVTTAFPENTALVGNYREGAVLWLRSGVALSASDSHEDFFTKRMVALMAELRAAFAAWQPAAFCEVTGV